MILTKKKQSLERKEEEKKLSYNNIRLYFVLYRGKIKKKNHIKEV